MKGKNRIDGSDLSKKKIVLNPGVNFIRGKRIFEKFLEEHWDNVKNSVKKYEYNTDYKSLGCGYSIDGDNYFIYPTYISFVISLVKFEGFCEIK